MIRNMVMGAGGGEPSVIRPDLSTWTSSGGSLMTAARAISTTIVFYSDCPFVSDGNGVFLTWMTIGSPAYARCFRSTDYGVTWTYISSFDAAPILGANAVIRSSEVIYSGPGIITVCASGSTAVSTDNGLTWTNYVGSTTVSELTPRLGAHKGVIKGVNGKLYHAYWVSNTTSNGSFAYLIKESSDYGVTWSQTSRLDFGSTSRNINSAITYSPACAKYAMSSTAAMYAATTAAPTAYGQYTGFFAAVGSYVSAIYGTKLGFYGTSTFPGVCTNTTDTWTKLTTPPAVSSAFVDEATTVANLGTTGNLFRTSNLVSWSTTTHNIPALIGVATVYLSPVYYDVGTNKYYAITAQSTNTEYWTPIVCG